MEFKDMGSMMNMMSEMMECCTPDMMTEMMPECLGMMLSNIPKDKQIDFVSRMINNLIEKISKGMTPADKKKFIAKMVEGIKA